MGNAESGKTISSLVLSDQSSAPSGQFDVMIADMSILSADGTVTQVVGGQPGGACAATGSSAITDLTCVSEKVNSARDFAGPPQTVRFYFRDPLGTAQLEFTSAGFPLWKGEFTPFGQEIDLQTTANNYKFTGKERDTESGLDYFGARYYASSMGRFMSPDPSGLYFANPNNPQSLNLYSYAQNNPLRYTDLTGMAYCQWDDGTHDDSADTGVEGAVNSGTECTNAGGTWSHADGLNDDGSQIGSGNEPAFTTTATLNTATDQTSVSTSGPCYDPQVVYNYMLFQQLAQQQPDFLMCVAAAYLWFAARHLRWVRVM